MPDFSGESATGDIVYLEEETEEPEKYSKCTHKPAWDILEIYKNGSEGYIISVYKGKYRERFGYKIYCVIIGYIKFAYYRQKDRKIRYNKQNLYTVNLYDTIHISKQRILDKVTVKKARWCENYIVESNSLILYWEGNV